MLTVKYFSDNKNLDLIIINYVDIMCHCWVIK